MEGNWRIKKWRAVEIACFRVLHRSVHLWLHIRSCFGSLFLLGVLFIFWLLFPVRLLSSRWCLALVSFRRWFAHPLWICRGSSTSCRKASRRPLALLAFKKENFAEVDYSFHFFLCKVNMIACSVRGDVESRSYIAKHSSLRNFFSPVL